VSDLGSSSSPIVALCGGVGAARFLRGLCAAVPPADADGNGTITAIVNTGDDREFYGVAVCPDLDIVTYTLAGRVDPVRGYGLEDDSFALVDALGSLGHETWFRLGDRDFATSQHRTVRMREGMGLAEVSDDIRRQFGVDTRIVPMSEDPCPTIVELEGGRRLHFEEYLARDGAPDEVTGVDLSAAQAATPAPGVLEAIAAARTLLVCPSNPVVSIGPILAVQGVRDAIEASPAPVVAVSPIVGGAPVKGPADRLLRGLGREVSARGIAEWYTGLIGGIVIDERDAALAEPIEALGVRCAVVDTIMRDVGVAAALAETTLSLAASLR
jgi:LPPG:FO 2-phospho-L-lactate transferase